MIVGGTTIYLDQATPEYLLPEILAPLVEGLSAEQRDLFCIAIREGLYYELSARLVREAQSAFAQVRITEGLEPEARTITYSLRSLNSDLEQRLRLIAENDSHVKSVQP